MRRELLLWSMAMVAVIALSHGKIANCDQENVYGREECILRTPQCLEYEYVPDSQNPGRFIVHCLKCQEGLVPHWTFQNQEVDEFTDLPENPLFMCGPNEQEQPVSCTSIMCFAGALKFCEKYVAKDLTFGAPGAFQGSIQCLQCSEQYEPVNRPIRMTYDIRFSDKVTQSVCTRKEGTFPCGAYCQAEFPGCARIQISKVQGGRDTDLPETAIFRCVEAVPGFNIIQQVARATTNFMTPKVLVFPAYESDVQECNTKVCQSTLVNCEAYYTVSSESVSQNYFCKRCKSTMVPIPSGSQGQPLMIAVQSQQVYEVCQQAVIEPTQCDSKCKIEFPGCDVISVPTVINENGSSVAVYNCLKCADGFNSAPDENYTPSWIHGRSSRNTKIRCVPKEVLEPTPVSGEIAYILPKCLKYTAKFKPEGPNNAMEYACHQCEQGWEPTSDPVYAEWFSKSERPVCKHIPFPAPVECNEDCKQLFPDCDRVMVSKDPKGHNIYQCLECSNGFYPIPYEREVAGRLAFEDHKMRDQSKLFLCSDQPRERYFALVTCDSHNIFSNEEEGCVIDENCRQGVWAKSENQALFYFKCLECNNGYRLSKESRHFYIGDPTRCQPLPRASSPRVTF